MLHKSGKATPAAVFVDLTGRRRRAVRLALVAIMVGAAAGAAFVLIGLTSGPYAPRTALGPAASARSGGGGVTDSTSDQTAASQKSGSSSKVTEASRACTVGAKYCVGRGCRSSGAVTTISFDSVQAAFNANGIASANDVSAGNFDCRGFSFEAQQLAADGFAPGHTLTVDGQTLTLPDVPAGAPDEITAEGQVIHLSRSGESGSELGFLGAGEFGTQSGNVIVNYVGGSVQLAKLRLADWYADSPVPGGVIAASALWNVPAAHASAFRPEPVAVYYAQIAIDPAKTIASVKLPDNPRLHLFDVGIPVAARYPSVSAADNDTGLAPAGNAQAGNYDGAGHSYDSAALSAAGLKPGQSVTAQGVSFTWPRYAPGHFDNVRAEGQTIAVSGSGKVLGFLGAGLLGTQSGTVTIHYTNGSSQSVVLTFADWYANRAAAGGTVVATVPWNRLTGTGQHHVSVYSATVPLESGKTVASVTLPVNFNLHVFAIAAGK
jgi:hypothetical protein